MKRSAFARLEQLNQIKLNEAQKDDVLSFFAKREVDLALLNAINTDGVAPMVQAIPSALCLREDVIEQPVSRDALLAQAPLADAECWCVPRVIE